jgi:suppressor of ftsI
MATSNGPELRDASRECGGRRPRHQARLLSASVALAVVALALGGCGGGKPIVQGCISNPPPTIHDGFPESDVRASENGVLETTLRASYSPVTLNGHTYTTMHYEDSVPGPTLVVCPGDTLIVHLENDLGNAPKAWGPTPPTLHAPGGQGQLTNLHVHGLHVSPRGNSDNVFLSIAPKWELTYTYHIPEDEPPGMYWYHPHRHGFVESQVYAGMFGAIYVQGGLDELPGVRDIPTRTMIINSLQLGKARKVTSRAKSSATRPPLVVPTAKSSTAKSPYLINGTIDPTIDIAPGELQRWRILNANDNAMVRLSLPHGTFYVLANDGITLQRISPQKTLLLGPAERREVLVRGGPAGTYELTSDAFRQFQGGRVPAATIATVSSKGSRRHDPLPGPVLDRHVEDLRGAKIAQHHRIVYTEKQVRGGNFEFLINGKVFNPNRVDQVMTLGQVNEWTLVNRTTEWHTFHIHVNDFQVTSVKLHRRVPGVSPGGVRDVAPGEVDPEDTVKMPPESTVKMLTRPTDFTGKFVFHCHMLFHEDHGMMGVVRTVRR